MTHTKQEEKKSKETESFEAWFLVLKPVDGVKTLYWRTDADLKLKSTTIVIYPKKKIAEEAARTIYTGEVLIARKCTITYEI